MNLKYLLAISTFSALIIGISPVSLAAENPIVIHAIDDSGVGEEIGTVTTEDTEYGLLLTPDLTNIPPGIHGFHLHENPSCDTEIKDGEVTPGLAAGGHYDPENTGSHEGPYGDGHLGDLPPLIADEEGVANLPVLAPRLTQSDLAGHSLMVHSQGDNYSDQPEKLGGGGGRIACGVVE